MKCDISVTGKIGLFGSTFGHLIYQNLDYEACMLDTWSQGMSQNSYCYQQNDWWEETVFFCLPNHVFQLAHFIGKIAMIQITKIPIFTYNYLKLPKITYNYHKLPVITLNNLK